MDETYAIPAPKLPPREAFDRIAGNIDTSEPAWRNYAPGQEPVRRSASIETFAGFARQTKEALNL